MSWEQVREFFAKEALWIAVVGGLVVAGVAGLVKWVFGRKKEAGRSVSVGDVETGERSASQVAMGDGAKQEIKIDKSRHEDKSVHVSAEGSSESQVVVGDGAKIETKIDKRVHVTVEAGGTLNMVDYQDGVAQSEKLEVRKKFAEGRVQYGKGEYPQAIDDFLHCLELEQDHEKRAALNLQIGNCYYKLQKYIKAAKFYGAGLGESRKAGNREGEAANLVGMGSTYIGRPASRGEAKGENIRSAIECYKRALQMYKKDEYPTEYAGVQNNLGNAYTDLPSASPQGRVRSAAEYGYHDGVLLGNAGHLRVTVTPAQAPVDYVRSYMPGEESGTRRNAAVVHLYVVKADQKTAGLPPMEK